MTPRNEAVELARKVREQVMVADVCCLAMDSDEAAYLIESALLAAEERARAEERERADAVVEAARELLPLIKGGHVTRAINERLEMRADDLVLVNDGHEHIEKCPGCKRQAIVDALRAALAAYGKGEK